MKKLLIIGFIAIILFSALAILFYRPIRPPQKIIEIAISSIKDASDPRTFTATEHREHGPAEISQGFVMSAVEDSNGWSRLCNVTISNRSNFPLLIYAGEGGLWFQVKYLTNGIWQEYSARTIDGGPGMFPPHHLDKNNEFEIPNGATAVKIGLPFAVNTWNTISSRRGIPGFIKKFFLRQDFEAHSKVEWSDEYLIESNSLRKAEQ